MLTPREEPRKKSVLYSADCAELKEGGASGRAVQGLGFCRGQSEQTQNQRAHSSGRFANAVESRARNRFEMAQCVQEFVFGVA